MMTNDVLVKHFPMSYGGLIRCACGTEFGSFIGEAGRDEARELWSAHVARMIELDLAKMRLLTATKTVLAAMNTDSADGAL